MNLTKRGDIGYLKMPELGKKVIVSTISSQTLSTLVSSLLVRKSLHSSTLRSYRKSNFFIKYCPC